jgi:carboxypeptidase family protein
MRTAAAVRSCLLIQLLACVSSGSIAAQTDTTRIMIAGTVVDPFGNPIEGTEVRVVGTTLSAMSSAAGTFRIFAPRARQTLVQLRRPGYRAQLLKLDGDWSGRVLLEPGVFELPEIKVTGRYAKPARYAGTTKYDDYFRRRRIGFGQFISREEIEQRNPFRTVDLFQARAGIKTSINPPGAAYGSVVAFARCHESPPKINVYIDGRKLLGESSSLAGSVSVVQSTRGSGDAELGARRLAMASVGEMLDRIPPGDIELIEIFRGPGELPGEFNDGNCGAISIWTRWAGR